MAFEKVIISGFQYRRDREPDECPCCHCNCHPEEIAHSFTGVGHKDRKSIDSILEIVYGCPRQECGRLFIARYRITKSSRIFSLYACVPITPKSTAFPKEVESVSPEFVAIFSEAAAAEAYGLKRVAGPGYRKALEYLVKDYLIKSYPDKEKEITSEFLGACIKRIGDTKIKKCAKRAAWVGNDETHYKRKWLDKGMGDLKTLIKLVVNWIESEILTQQYEEDMSD